MTTYLYFNFLTWNNRICTLATWMANLGSSDSLILQGSRRNNIISCRLPVTCFSFPHISVFRNCHNTSLHYYYWIYSLVAMSDEVLIFQTCNYSRQQNKSHFLSILSYSSRQFSPHPTAHQRSVLSYPKPGNASATQTVPRRKSGKSDVRRLTKLRKAFSPSPAHHM